MYLAGETLRHYPVTGPGKGLNRVVLVTRFEQYSHDPPRGLPVYELAAKFPLLPTKVIVDSPCGDGV